MAYTFTSDEFLNYLKQVGPLPASQLNFSDDLLLTIADYQIVSVIAPLLKSLDNSFYVETTDINFASGQAAYTIPQFAMWNTIRDAYKLYNNTLVRLQRIMPSQLTSINLSVTGEPVYCYIQGNQIMIAPYPDLTLSLSMRIEYWRRPGKLVVIASAAKVQSVNYATGQVTYTAPPPSTFTSSSIHDFYSAISPFQREQTAIQATALAGAVQTFPAASVANLQPGDYVCVTGETVFTAIPAELRELLVKLVLKQLTKSQMDIDRYQIEANEIMEQYKIAQKSPGDRILAQPIPLTFTQDSKVQAPLSGWWIYG